MGSQKRKLYTDSGLATIDTMNPIVFKGIDISEIGNDLLDRAIFLELEEPEDHLSEDNFWSDIRELAKDVYLGRTEGEGQVKEQVEGKTNNPNLQYTIPLHKFTMNFYRWVNESKK